MCVCVCVCVGGGGGGGGGLEKKALVLSRVSTVCSQLLVVKFYLIIHDHTMQRGDSTHQHVLQQYGHDDEEHDPEEVGGHRVLDEARRA